MGTAAWTVWVCAGYLRLSQASNLERNRWRRPWAWGGVHWRSWTGVSQPKATLLPSVASNGWTALWAMPVLSRPRPCEARCNGRPRPHKRLLVSLDWVDVRCMRCLVLAARLRGRALPLLRAVYRHQELFRSQNNPEYGLLRLLRTMVPRSTQVVILADRGFGRAEMDRECQKLKLHYVTHTRPDVYVKHPESTDKLLDLPLAV